MSARLEDVLAEHQHLRGVGTCTCGAEVTTSDGCGCGDTDRAWTDHLADVVRGWLAERAADETVLDRADIARCTAQAFVRALEDRP